MRNAVVVRHAGFRGLASGYQPRAPYLAITPLFRGPRSPLVPLALIASIW